jgi:hypothetical protein
MHSCIDPTSDLNDTYIEKPREMSQFGKKSAKVYHCLYRSIEQLQVALWTFMFIMLGLNNEKSTHTLSLQFFQLLSLLCIPPSRNPPSCLLGQFDY